ncbi:MAG: GAF domain-containing protein [Ectothiorhodospiraceae bacterium]|nr:GAF domain-containing protein [Ectothiorhodospiraceae bacterium]
MSNTPAKTPVTGFRALGTNELYIPLTGLVLIFLLIIATTFGVYIWPQKQDLFFIVQLVLTGFGLLLIIRIMRCVKIRLLAPLALLREWAQRMLNGDLSARVPQPEQGEFALLACDINKLGESLRALTREMDDEVNRQTITLQRKTRTLEILYDVAAHSNSAKDIDELLIAFLHTLNEIVYAHAGTVRLVTDDNQMRLVGSVGLDENTIERIRMVPIEHCLCAQEFSKNMLLCQNHFKDCENIVSELMFAGDKLENIAIPLRYNNRTLGIYNLFVEKLGLTEREDIIDILTNIGQHLSMAIAKSHWEAESHRLSIMQERTMLAHELHDSLAQTLASLRFRVSMLQETLQQDSQQNADANDEVEQIKFGLDDANFELRELLAHFRIRMDERGLIPATEGLIERFKNQGDIQIFFQNECPDLRLQPVLEVHLLHIIQEALTNIRKHSNAKHVRVLLNCTEQQQFHLLIEDDGMGINAETCIAGPGEHVGLTIMRERAQRIGAELTIESEPGEGTRIELEIQHAEKSPLP